MLYAFLLEESSVQQPRGGIHNERFEHPAVRVVYPCYSDLLWVSNVCYNVGMFCWFPHFFDYFVRRVYEPQGLLRTILPNIPAQHMPREQPALHGRIFVISPRG